MAIFSLLSFPLLWDDIDILLGVQQWNFCMWLIRAQWNECLFMSTMQTPMITWHVLAPWDWWVLIGGRIFKRVLGCFIVVHCLFDNNVRVGRVFSCNRQGHFFGEHYLSSLSRREYSWRGSTDHSRLYSYMPPLESPPDPLSSSVTCHPLSPSVICPLSTPLPTPSTPLATTGVPDYTLKPHRRRILHSCRGIPGPNSTVEIPTFSPILPTSTPSRHHTHFNHFSSDPPSHAYGQSKSCTNSLSRFIIPPPDDTPSIPSGRKPEQLHNSKYKNEKRHKETTKPEEILEKRKRRLWFLHRTATKKQPHPAMQMPSSASPSVSSGSACQ